MWILTFPITRTDQSDSEDRVSLSTHCGGLSSGAVCVNQPGNVVADKAPRKGDAMIIHASIPADDPERVARVIAELWRGESFAFLAGTFIAMAGDDRGSQIEVAKRGNEIVPAETMMSFQVNKFPSAHTEVHLNVQTPLSVDEALAIAKREGWTARVCDRGGSFKVIEFWLENKFMLELMTEEETKRYRNIMMPGKLRAIMAARSAG